MKWTKNIIEAFFPIFSSTVEGNPFFFKFASLSALILKVESVYQLMSIT